MDVRDWLQRVGSEYLSDFVRDGGASVKFVVAPTPAARQAVLDGLRDTAGTYGYQFAFADGASTRLHMIERLFHAVARQVDWDALTRAYLADLLASYGVRLPEGHERFSLPAIAELNQRDESFLRGDVSKWVQGALLRDYALSREFRRGMTFLCLTAFEPSDRPGLHTTLLEWLRGDLRLISALKSAYIFQKVARHNARHMLFSLPPWLRRSGQAGLVLALDITRYLETRPHGLQDDSFYYGTTGVLDLYEVLRQLVDGTDQLEHAFVVVLTGPEFLQDERRGLNAYQALRLRVWDDVRDRDRPNPLASLVRLEAAA